MAAQKNVWGPNGNLDGNRKNEFDIYEQEQNRIKKEILARQVKCNDR